MTDAAMHEAARLASSGALVKRDVLASAQIMSEAQFDNVSRMAKALAASGQFKDVTQWEQAFGRILLGSDMGLTPTQALMSIDVVRGNVQVRGKRLLAWIRQSENYDYKILERTPEKGAIRFFEKSKQTGKWEACEPDITFTLEQAKAKGLWAKGGGWDNWPENMCLWRCASIGFNLFCPELSGGVAVYTEADEFVDSTATDITSGEGDGSAPGWDGLPDEMVHDITALLTACADAGRPLDVASVQMRLNGRPDAVAAWMDETKATLTEDTGGEG